MSGNESAAEEIVELGVEIINPGGRPDELEEAARAWRRLKSEIDRTFSTLDKQVNSTVGHTWRGPAAEAFQDHWNKRKSSVEKATENFDEAANGLDKAAKAIREVNAEIYDIYVEIGIPSAFQSGCHSSLSASQPRRVRHASRCWSRRRSTWLASWGRC